MVADINNLFKDLFGYTEQLSFLVNLKPGNDEGSFGL